MISKYLKALIESNNRVIIPEFGAFMIQDTPSGKVISFNDFLTFNDGLLVNQIIKDKKISKSEALDIIKEFIQKTEASFSKDNAVVLEGLGKLYKDTQNNVKFESDLAAKAPAETTQKEASNTKSAEETEKAEEQAPKITLDANEEITQGKQEDSQEDNSVVSENKETPLIELDKKQEESLGNDHNDESDDDFIDDDEDEDLSNNENPYTESKKKSKLNLLLIIAASVIIVSVIVWALVTFDIFGSTPDKDMAAETPKVQIPMADSSVAEKDTAPAAETAPLEEPKVVEEPYVEPEVKEKRYFIIGGSFKQKANAERYMTDLNSQGFESEIIKRTNGFHAVCFYSFAERDKAFAKWREMRPEKPEIWVLIKQ
jgi:nucleoid DNA-binding protein